MTRFAISIGLLLFSCALARGQTIFVDIEDADVIDVNPETATIFDLPGPDGHISFSEAMIASNNTPGRQTVGFHIPQNEWSYLQWFYPGRAVVHGSMFYANAYDSVVIDGTTQTAFTGNTNPLGNEVVIMRGGGLYIPANHSRITGLDNTQIFVEGSDAIIQNNSTIGLQLSGGSGALVKNNIGGGFVNIDQSNNNIVVGNVLNQVRVIGYFANDRPAQGNRIGGPLRADRNILWGNGFVSSHGIPSGFALQLFDSLDTTVENNWIGLTTNGLSKGNEYTTIGIYFDSENRNVLVRNNRIAAILAVARPLHAPSYYVGTAIYMSGTGDGIKLIGNKVGLNANNELMGSVVGLFIADYYLGPYRNVTIGGIGRSGNEIAGNQRQGILVGKTLSGVKISGNSIHDNGGLGIDLIDTMLEQGITMNDPGDSDLGGNELQNFPVVDSAIDDNASLRITGALDSTRNRSFVVEFFASPTSNPSGFGEGRFYLGNVRGRTNAAGELTFDVSFGMAGLPIQAGWVVTATATDRVTMSTSEFSEAIQINGQ